MTPVKQFKADIEPLLVGATPSILISKVKALLSYAEALEGKVPESEWPAMKGWSKFTPSHDIILPGGKKTKD